MSVAILPGSYDPITLGHLDIIRRAAVQYDEVVVAVMNNATKRYTFDMGERAEMARLATANIPGVRVVADDGMLVDLFDRLGATVIVKGVRNEKDRAYEEEMAAYNLSKNPRAKTVLLDADARFSDISSTRVRRLLLDGMTPKDLLPGEIIEYLAKKGVLKQGETHE